MRIRATLKLRNDKMLAAREAANLTQAEAAELAGIATSAYQALESFDFSNLRVASHVEAVALALGLSREDILPAGAEGLKHKCQHVQTINAELHLLAGVEDRLMLPPPERLEVTETRETLKERFCRLLDTLSSREREIIRLRYGLDGNEPHTLEELSGALRLTKERVRQIEMHAVRKLSHPTRSRVVAFGLDGGKQPSAVNLPAGEWTETGNRKRARPFAEVA